MKSFLLLPLLVCLVAANPREARSAEKGGSGSKEAVKAPVIIAPHNLIATNPNAKPVAAPAATAVKPVAAPVATAAKPVAATAAKPAVAVAAKTAAKPVDKTVIGAKPVAEHGQHAAQNAGEAVQQLGCDYVAFSDRALTVADIVANGSFPNPAACINYLKTNMNVYTAVEYNYQNSTCRAVKSLLFNHTVASTVATIYVLKPNATASAQSLGWYFAFYQFYTSAGKSGDHLTILAHISDDVKEHVVGVAKTAQDNKCSVGDAAKTYHTTAVSSGKEIEGDFETWWGGVKDHCHEAAKSLPKGSALATDDDESTEDWFGKFETTLKTVAQGVSTVAKTVGAGVKTVAQKAGSEIKEVAKTVATDVKTVAGKVGSGVATAAKKVGSEISEVAQKAGAVAKTVGTAIATGAKTVGSDVASAAKTVATGAAAAAKTVATGAESIIQTVVSDAESVAKTVATGAAAAAKTVATGAESVAVKVGTSIEKTAKTVITGTETVAKTVVSEVESAAKTVATGAESVAAKVGTAVQAAAQKTGSAVKETVQKVGTAVQTAVQKTGSAVKETAQVVGSAVKSAANAVASEAKSVVSGIEHFFG